MTLLHDPPTVTSPGTSSGTLVHDVAAAAAAIAPLFPLTSFVAVNPLRGFEHLRFDDACLEGRRWFGGRTHLPLATTREALRRGELTTDHLRAAIVEHDPLAAANTIAVGARSVGVLDLIEYDLVHGPVGGVVTAERSPWARAVEWYVGTWAAAFSAGHGRVAVPHRSLGFYRAWRRAAAGDPRLARLVGRDGRRRIAALPDDATAAIAAAAAELGIEPAGRTEAFRAALLTLPGWSGHARWADDWAPAGDGTPRLSSIDLLAVLLAVSAAATRHDLVTPPAPAATGADDDTVLTERVEAATTWCTHAAEATHDVRRAVRSVLAAIGGADREAIWLAAIERATRERLLADVAPGRRTGVIVAGAQLVCCIDVRSEVLRRHLEAVGPYETFGFAGFFGVPVRWTPEGSSQSEARCPVLLTPAHDVAEVARTGGDRLDGARARRGALGAFHSTKASLGGPFALAEAAGWVTGPVAAARALRRPRRVRERDVDRSTRPAIAAETHVGSGLPLAERVRIAESIVRTIGCSSFAPLVVLCGHGSRTVNNPHAAALDCGACGGAPGGASARVAAAILDDPAVREALRGRGIDIPDTTWFVPAEHDTTSDTIELLDVDDVPASHLDRLARLDRDLAVAGERTAAERATRLPGPASAIRARGRDWAQVRPEWGLAGNAAFLAAPRSASAGVDLEGRVFLHSYDADADADGSVLEAIMTAPLVVAQWINAQYYFSSVDPDVFGAGDKLQHNPVGGIGVLRGQAGDLAVGLPAQSVAVDGRLAHLPVRLLAMIEAPLERIEAIVARHAVLRDLLGGGWIAIAARATRDDEWSMRTPAGTWTSWIPAGELAGANVSALSG